MSRTVVFCVPGNRFSQHFIRSWTDLLHWCHSHEIHPILSSGYHDDQYIARNLCLGGQGALPDKTKPFLGKIAYDFVMWLDSDQLFTPDDFANLLRHDRDVVTGLYKHQNRAVYPCIESWDEISFDRDGGFRFTLIEELQAKKGPFEIVANGLGFALFKRGVLESLSYPWFRPYSLQTPKNQLILGNDIGLFFRLRENGFTLFADPEVVVGHEKTTRYTINVG